MELNAKKFETQGKTFEIVSNCNGEEIFNNYYLNNKAKNANA